MLGGDISARGMFGHPPVTLYTSTEAHGCLEKCVEQMGIGTNSLRRIPVDHMFHIRTDLLVDRIREDLREGLKPMCVIGSAGTVNTGAVDPLDELAEIASQYGLWLHIDGAYGGMAAALESQKDLFKGLDRADSIALDFHKWLYQPYEAGCALFKGWDASRKTFHHQVGVPVNGPHGRPAGGSPGPELPALPELQGPEDLDDLQGIRDGTIAAGDRG